MKKIELNEQWEFYESNESTGFMLWERPEPTIVDLPHDYIIIKPREAKAAGGPANAYFGEGEGVYRKVFLAEDAWKDKRILLDIDGAYMNAEIVLNGEVLGLHPYGYTPYQVELTDYIRHDKQENRLKIITQSRQPSTRWYSGGGLYRSVALWVGGKICVKPWDVFIRTERLEHDSACLRLDYAVDNKSERSAELAVLCEIIDAEENIVWSKKCNRMIEKGEVQEVTEQIVVENPHLWDIQNPYLYKVRLTLLERNEVLDTTDTKFGIRFIEVSAQEGLRLNHTPLKLKGGCLHHDNGFLGACAYPTAERRKIKHLKVCGYNAVRIGHNPPSLAMLEACDELGMLLLDECFDAWRMGKMPLDYHLYFEDWWERDIEYMIKRDRNHPCVISYSIGNEIAERDGKNDGAIWSEKLVNKMKSLDDTRFIMSGLTGIFDQDKEPGSNFDANVNGSDATWAKLTEDYCKPLDVVGYNYLLDRYERDHELFPERIMVCSESHAFNTYDYWQKVKKLPYVIGDFIWAAVDYLGEVGVGKVYWQNDKEQVSFMAPYPWRSSWQSDLMLTGERRPQSYYREIMWGTSENTYVFTTHPKHYGEKFFSFGWHWYDVKADWTFENEYVGKKVRVDAYGAGEEAEFVLNGKSYGFALYEKNIASMDIPYEKGELEVITYRNGEVLSRGYLRTAQGEKLLKLTLEEQSQSLKAGEIAYIKVSLEDEEGTLYQSAEEKITVEITGNAKLLACGSGNPCSEDQIGSNCFHLYNGTGLIIAKAGKEGVFNIKAEGKTIGSAVCSCQIV